MDSVSLAQDTANNNGTTPAVNNVDTGVSTCGARLYTFGGTGGFTGTDLDWLTFDSTNGILISKPVLKESELYYAANNN